MFYFYHFNLVKHSLIKLFYIFDKFLFFEKSLFLEITGLEPNEWNFFCRRHEQKNDLLDNVKIKGTNASYVFEKFDWCIVSFYRWPLNFPSCFLELAMRLFKFINLESKKLRFRAFPTYFCFTFFLKSISVKLEEKKTTQAALIHFAWFSCPILSK